MNVFLQLFAVTWFEARENASRFPFGFEEGTGRAFLHRVVQPKCLEDKREETARRRTRPREDQRDARRRGGCQHSGGNAARQGATKYQQW